MAVRRRPGTPKSQGQTSLEPARVQHRPSQEGAFLSSTAAVVMGRMLPSSTPTAPLVDFAGNARGPLRARTTVPLDGGVMERAVASGQGVMLVFENDDPGLPIVTGLIWTGQPASPFEKLLVARRATDVPRVAPPAEARLDGERVILEGKREVILRCGQASITLRSDGKIVVRGAYVETYSKGLNRIKGASVKIN